MIVEVIKSPVKYKRFRAYIMNKKKQIQYIDFGLEGGKTYIDGRTDEERKNYLARHMGNKTEAERILNLTPSAATLSAYLLWGNSRDLKTNIKYLNKLMG